MEKIQILAVAGPTASGKTALAVSLAQAFHGEVVSADSMQVYRGMDIATAKPTKEEMRGVPHHLIDFVEPESSFSVAEYVRLARETLAGLAERERLPVVVGGTGLYLDSLLQNIQYDELPASPAIRAALLERVKAEGGQALLDELQAVDPETAGALHPNNVGRIVRAWEVYRASGVPMSEHRRRSRLEPPPYDSFLIGLDYRDRQTLYSRINSRVDRMMEQGLLEEARHFFLSDISHTARQAIGYKELLPYLRGEQTLETAVKRLKQETRRYAKRQLSWFRRNPAVHWLYADEYPDAAALADAACEMAAAFLENGEAAHGK